MYNYNINFGYVKVKLKEKMDAKNITVNQMSKMTNVAYDIIKKYYYGRNYSISMEILAKFCFILDCKIGDILEYIPSKTLVR